MRTKAWLIVLPLLGLVGGALAADVAQQGEGAQVKAAPAKEQRQMHRHAPKHLPHGDLRHCLDLTSNEAIIRCAETRPKH